MQPRAATPDDAEAIRRNASWRQLPRGVWALGFASLFMDTSSELIHSLLPLFLVGTLGASMASVGLIEGFAEATASIVKVFSGALSDRLGRRKPLVVLGYGLAALSKPLFPLAGSLGTVAAARCIDRVGKGIRGAPRDALVAELSAPAQRGAAYGLRQGLDSVGALLGPLLAALLIGALAFELRAAMWFALVPAVATVTLLLVFVREPERSETSRAAASKPLRFADARRLPPRYWRLVGIGALFTLARFSEAFLLLRAQDCGLAAAQVPLVMIAMNACYAGGAYPAGAASDRMRARTLLLLGLALLLLADLLLAAASAPLLVFAGAALWGLHMALTQGLFAKLVAERTPADLLGTGFGVFHLTSGMALLAASALAGALWSSFGAPATFAAGAAFALLTALGLLAGPRSAPKPEPA